MMLLLIDGCFRSGVCHNIASIFIAIFFAILFIQSGLDKVLNYKSEYEWTKEHFSKSILMNSVSILFPVLLFLELITGAISLAAPFVCWFKCDGELYFFSGVLSAITLLGLFFGQRVAKDYAGAVSIAGYFIIAIIGIYLSV